MHALTIRPRTSVALLATLIVALLLGGAGPTTAAVPTASADPDAALHWSVAPSDDAGPDGRVSLRHELEPGESVEDAIAVTNLGGAAARFGVSVGDGVLGAQGAFDVAADEPVAGGRWMRVDGLDDGTVRLAPGQTRVLPVTISVPGDATPGDHPAGVVVARTGDEDGVTVTHRIGVRLHLRVTGEIASALEVGDVESEFRPSLVPFAPGTLEVRYRVENTGNVRLGASALVKGGLPLGLLRRDARTVAELLPGDTTVVRTTVRAWPTFLLVGGVEVRGLSVGDDGSPLPDPAAVGLTRPAVSWTGLLLLLVAGCIVWRRRRRRRRRRPVVVATGPAPTSGVTPADAPRVEQPVG